MSGPGTVSFAEASAADTTATFSTTGLYVLRLTASDGALISTDDVTVTVNNAGQMALSVLKRGAIHDDTEAAAYSFPSITVA